MKRMNFFPRKDKRRSEAKERQQSFVALSKEQKLEKLRSRGHAHCKEAQKLANNH